MGQDHRRRGGPGERHRDRPPRHRRAGSRRPACYPARSGRRDRRGSRRRCAGDPLPARVRHPQLQEPARLRQRPTATVRARRGRRIPRVPRLHHYRPGRGDPGDRTGRRCDPVRHHRRRTPPDRSLSMPGLGDLFGKGSIAEQIFVWGVLNQVVTALASPYFTELTYFVNEHHQVTELPPSQLAELVTREFITAGEGKAGAAKAGLDGTKFDQLGEAARPSVAPADLAQLVVRNFMPRAEAHTEAAKSGLSAGRLDELIKIAADAPAPGDLAVALRRKVIPADGTADGPPSFAQGIREGRLADKYIPMIKALATEWPTPTDALQAELEGQLSHAQALAEYERLGGDPQFYTWLFNTRGNGPGSVSYQQAFLEGPWRNKWLEPFLALRTYVTPPRSVVAMVHNGSLTDAEAAAELAKSGLDANLIAAYIAEGHQVAAATDRALTQSAVLDLYADRIIGKHDAHELLTALNYSDDNATYLIELTDLRRSIAAVNTAVSRVHTLYVSHKITRDAALAVLSALKVPGDQVQEITATWDLEAAVNVKQLTEAQIVNAWFKGVIDTDEAVAELVATGYTARDATILLTSKDKGRAPPLAPPGPNPVGTIP